jgi:hypothetical protein
MAEPIVGELATFKPEGSDWYTEVRVWDGKEWRPFPTPQEAHIEVRELVRELTERLEWYIQEDETYRGDNTEEGGTNWDEENAYWIEGQDRAIAAVERARSFLNHAAQPLLEIEQMS